MTNDIQMPELETERLRLRPFGFDDASRLVQLANTPEISYRLASMPYPYAEQDANDYIEIVASDDFTGKAFAICLKQTSLKQNDGELIGAVGYGPSLAKDQSADEIDFGYWLGVDYWRQGYGFEAAKLVMDYAFKHGGVVKIDTDYLVENHASGRILQKLGFQDLGPRQCYSKASGVCGASRHMRLTLADWQTKQRGAA